MTHLKIKKGWKTSKTYPKQEGLSSSQQQDKDDIERICIAFHVVTQGGGPRPARFACLDWVRDEEDGPGQTLSTIQLSIFLRVFLLLASRRIPPQVRGSAMGGVVLLAW